MSRTTRDQALARVQELIETRPDLLAMQGAVVGSRQYVGGRSRGPYYRLAYRDRGRQCWVYLGPDEQLANEVRELLHRVHTTRDELRALRTLRSRLWTTMRRHKSRMAAELEEAGFRWHGYQVRKWPTHS